MNLTRQEDISLYLYIRDVVIAPRYSELEVQQPLTPSLDRIGRAIPNTWDIGYPLQEDLSKSPFKRGSSSGLGRGMIYFDSIGDTCVFGVEQSETVSIYNGDITASGCRFNYLTGQVLASGDLTSYVADYKWYYVATLDAWPREGVPSLPVVSIELQTANPHPLQLGGGDIREGYWNIQIFGGNKGERDDLMDVIHEGIYMRSCPFYNFSHGMPLIGRGFFNDAFSSELHPHYSSLFFDKVEKRLSNLPNWGFYEQEQINRYRAEITFMTRAYKNG
jgi:hypothetical protein